MSKTVLLIDDSSSVRQLVSMTLSGAGYTAITAEDGSDGYDKAVSNKVDAVVTDLNMPVMNGFDFIRKYRAHGSSLGVPIILLTTEADPGKKAEGKSIGATGWITKPFTPEQLLAVVKKVTGS